MDADEAVAVARGSSVPCQGWHRCRRFWRRDLECPFHGKRPKKRSRRRKEEEEETDELEHEGPQLADAPDRERTGPRPKVGGAIKELVPVAVREPNVAPLKADVFQEEAFPDVGIPLLPPAIGTPLYIPDENVPKGIAPPGIPEDALAEIGVVGEEVFADMLASPEVSRAEMNAEIGGVAFEGGNPEYSELAWLFSALFAANAVTHLWQTYNERLSPGDRNKLAQSQPSPRKTVTGRKAPVKKAAKKVKVAKPPPQPPKPPPRPPSPLPAASPPRVPLPMGSSGGGGIGFQFESRPGEMEEPLPQETFNWIYNTGVNIGGGLDID